MQPKLLRTLLDGEIALLLNARMDKDKSARELEAARLAAIYHDKKRELGLTQEKLAALMGFSTQGAVSQYMTGRISMSNETLFRFAYHLQFDPSLVRPDIFEKMPIPEGAGQDLDAETLQFARRYAQLTDQDRQILRTLIEKLDR